VKEFKTRCGEKTKEGTVLFNLDVQELLLAANADNLLDANFIGMEFLTNGKTYRIVSATIGSDEPLMVECLPLDKEDL